MQRTQRNVDQTIIIIVINELSVKGTLNGLSCYCEITKPYGKNTGSIRNYIGFAVAGV